MGILVAELPHKPNTCADWIGGVEEKRIGKRCFNFTFRSYSLLSIYITFPENGGVRIRNSYAGDFEPSCLCDIKYTVIDDNNIRLDGADTYVIVKNMNERWCIEIYSADGELKTTIDNAAFRMWGYDINTEFASVKIRFPKTENEKIFGFGERFNSFYQSKNQVLMWNIDVLASPIGGPLWDDYCDKPQSYKNIPLIHSDRNYSIFFNTYLPIMFDIGNLNPNELYADIYGKSFDIYVWTKTPKENLKQYQLLTGKPYLPPI